MNKTKQKDVFLSGEGDAWFDRNHEYFQTTELTEHDPIIETIIKCNSRELPETTPKLLEIGCGEGKRLHWLTQNLKLDCFGIDPSTKAVSAARNFGLKASRGTADHLEFPDRTFDFLVFGFCLYLCDREDLFKIAAEAHRVLKERSWLIVHDFFSNSPTQKTYHHKEGVFSFKMDYRTLFDWHPDYTCFSHCIRHHTNLRVTDNPDEWVATFALRRHSA